MVGACIRSIGALLASNRFKGTPVSTWQDFRTLINNSQWKSFRRRCASVIAPILALFCRLKVLLLPPIIKNPASLAKGGCP
jgi:hypothetical protein